MQQRARYFIERDTLACMVTNRELNAHVRPEDRLSTSSLLINGDPKSM